MKQFIAIILLTLLCSCQDKTAKHLNVLSSLAGHEIVMPDNLTCRIQSDTIEFNFNDADYNIVAYIDSSDCTPCKMKLPVWDNLINRLKSASDATVAFVMVINSGETSELDSILKKSNFLHPICFDPAGEFSSHNKLPDKELYHTFMLDSNGEIVLVGNPAINPKIRELYNNIVFGDTTEYSYAVSTSLGSIEIGDSIVTHFKVHNGDIDTLTIQEIVPSCDCLTAAININTIQPHETAELSVTYIVDSNPGLTSRYVDIYFNEKESPWRHIIHGYINNNKNK
jgi:hypothetical protein